MQAPTITKDFTNKQLIIEKYFSAPRSKVWKSFTDDTFLVQWWGPKTWPASSKSFDFRPGGHWHYCMTGPDGTEAWGMLHYKEIVPMDYFIAENEFSDHTGKKNEDLPTNHWKNEFFDEGEATRVLITITFKNETNMNTIIAMGFEAGFSDALDNLDQLFLV